MRFDLSASPVVLRPRRWNPLAHRDPAAQRGIVSHSWASKVGTTAAERLRHGEPLALARRALEAPYTISAGVTSRGVPVVALAHPVTRYTYASDAGCSDFISIGIMGVFPFEESTRNATRHTALTVAMLAAVNDAMEWAAEILAESAGDGPHIYITHRQCINGRGDHAQCSGEAVVKMCLASQAVASGRIIADPDLVLVPEFGRPWPASWRSHLQTASGNVCDFGLPNSAALVSGEHHAFPLMPVGEDGNPAMNSA